MGLAIAVLMVVVCVSDKSGLPWGQLVLFILVAMVCELTPIDLGRDYCQVNLLLPLVMMTVLLHGALAVAILSVSAVFGANLLSWLSAHLAHRFPHAPQPRASPWRRVRAVLFRHVLPWIGRPWMGRHSAPAGWMLMNLSYNAAHLVLNAVSSAYVYVLLGGTPLASAEVARLSALGWLHTTAAGALALIILFAGDAMFYTIASGLYESLPTYNRTLQGFLLRCNIRLRQTFASTIRGDIFLGVLAAILVYLYVQIGTVAILVLFAPLYMVRDAVGQTLQQVDAYRETVTTLGAYMQRYHPYTRGHLKRVADLSERLAKELRLSAESVMLMPDAGMLHDIGKVAVSEEILDKVGKLTDEEWAVIKQHPLKGSEIVRHLPYLEKIVEWVKYHHKWADGSGYPDDGVGDGHIPIEAAIIAVVDAFDAMTDDRELSVEWVCDSCSYRPDDGQRPEKCPRCGTSKRRVYREPLSLDDAIDQLRRGAGSQFSPDVVRAFLRMIERDGVHIGD